MSFKFNPFTGTFDYVDEGGSLYLAPVATEGDLPLTDPNGAVRVVLATDRLYAFDTATSKWFDTGLDSSAAVGSVPNANGFSLSNVTDGDIIRPTLQLQPADQSNPGIISILDQAFTGVKTFDDIIDNGLDPDTVPYADSNRKLVPSSVTPTELEFLSGTSSNVQDQLDAKIDDTEKGANNGVATLDAGGKVPAAQLPNSVMEYKGNWDASTNTPTLADGTGNAGDVYRASVAGTQDLGSGSQTFGVGDLIIYSGSIWEKSPATDAVLSVNGLMGIVSLDTDDIPEGSNQYFNDERAQDAVGNILTDTATINFTYTDGGPTITADVLPGGVDHDQLLNFVANEHVDHSSVQIATGVDSGLTGGGDITATRNLSVDINGTTAETVPAAGDKLLIYDASATALKSMTRANFLTGIALSSTGDISETSFSGANNQSSPVDVTGLVFANASVRGFEAQLTVTVDATADLFEEFKLRGIQRGADWILDYTSVGDNSGVAFSITNAGQIQYLSSNYTGFSSLTMKFRAEALGV